eukprot:TRINITY_DN60138_c0_g3_i1.p1 TRINITY_DN60138_c0_g3~~TRINITY_DN60138_c0_g3_i1.p1  ORF type:complete len:413 (+),score=101.54 TRINITY_DN60138_c0_g3_i1:168-1406(+)
MCIRDRDAAAPEDERVAFVSTRECVALQDKHGVDADKKARRSGSFFDQLFSNGATEMGKAEIETSIARQAEDRRIKALRDQMNVQYLSINDFDAIRTVGVGAFSSVRLMQHQGNGEYFAAKIMTKRDILRLEMLRYVQTERDALLTMANRSPFVVQVEAVLLEAQTIVFIMEYLSGGELLSKISESESARLDESLAAFYTAQVLLGMEALHAWGWVHRDIKPENILLSARGYAKLADLGFCKQVGHGRDKKAQSSLGTPEYMAPEMIQALGHGKPLDYWCLGVLLYEMVVGSPPFKSEDPFSIYQLALKLDYQLDEQVSNTTNDLIQRLIVRNPEDRIGVSSTLELKNHDFFSGVDWIRLEDQLMDPPVGYKFDRSDPGQYFMSYPELPLDGGLPTQDYLSETEHEIFEGQI